MSQWGDSGEGQYLQAALAVDHGGIPLVTFPARPEPVNQYILVPAIALAGAGLEAGRAVIVLVNLGAALTLALLARRLATRHGEVAGVATAAIYLLSPIAATQGTMVDEEPIAAFFVALSLYFLLRDRWQSAAWNLPLSGLLLGLAILSRRSAFAVAFVWLLWILYTERGWAHRIRQAVVCFAPGVVVVVGFFAVVATLTSPSWALTGFFDYSSTYAQLVIPLSYRIGILGYLLIVAPTFFLLPLALALHVLHERGPARLANLVTMGVAVPVYALLVTYPLVVDYGLTENLTPNLVPLILLTAGIFTALVWKELSPTGEGPVVRWDLFLLVAGWPVAFLGLDFLARTQPFASYSGDGLAPLALLAGLWFATLVPRKGSAPAATPVTASVTAAGDRLSSELSRYSFPLLLILLLVLSSALVSVWMIGPTSPENGASGSTIHAYTIYRYPPSEVQEVGSYLHGAMRPNDTIFTFDTLFAGAAGRTITPNIAQYIDPYLDYFGLNAGAGVDAQPIPPGASNESPYPTAPPGFLPSTEGLMADWNATHLHWFVEGYVTTVVLDHSPLLNGYVSTHFHPVRSFGNPYTYDWVVVLEAGAPPSLDLTPSSSTPLASPPTCSADDNGTLYIGSNRSSQVVLVSVNGTTGMIVTPFAGVSSLRVLEGYLWVGSAVTPQVVAYPLRGGSPDLLNVGRGPFSFAADNRTSGVFVAANSSLSLTGLLPLRNGTGWAVQWRMNLSAPVTSLAVDPVSHRLFAAEPFNDSLLIVDDRNGATIGTWNATFAPSLVAFADGGLVAAWWGGLVYRVNLTNGTTPYIAGAFFVGPGVTSLDAAPAMGAVAISRERANTTDIVDPRTLLVLGSFTNISCPGAIGASLAPRYLGVVDACSDRVSWSILPRMITVTVTGPAGSYVEANNFPLANYTAPTTLHLWPQVLILSLWVPGTMNGYWESTVASNGTVALTPGPSLSGIAAQQTTYLWEMAVISLLTVLGAFVLLRWGEQDPESPAPGADEPTGPGPDPDAEALTAASPPPAPPPRGASEEEDPPPREPSTGPPDPSPGP